MNTTDLFVAAAAAAILLFCASALLAQTFTDRTRPILGVLVAVTLVASGLAVIASIPIAARLILRLIWRA